MKLTTNKIKLFTTTTFVIFSLISFGQDEENLVNNPSFEAVEKKIKKLGEIEKATGWFSATGGKADLFTENKIADISSPTNIYGKEVAKEGENYAGIVAYSYKNPDNPRSYVMSKLDVPLKKGMRYCVKFNVSLAEASKYAVNNIGAKLSKKPFGIESKGPLIEEPSLLHFDNDQKIISAKFNWTEICGVVRADGGEKYITIGNFISDGKTKSVRMKKDSKVKIKPVIAAYYYVDDVSVKLLNKNQSCDCQADEGLNQYSTTIYQKAISLGDDVTSQSRIEAQEIFFAFGKSMLTSQGKVSLDMIVDELSKNPDFKVQINGHNNVMEDNVGNENDYYADMDNKRIGGVMKYLIDKGIPESRLIPSQKGSSNPNKDIETGDNDDIKMAKNRRVTFVVRH